MPNNTIRMRSLHLKNQAIYENKKNKHTLKINTIKNSHTIPFTQPPSLHLNGKLSFGIGLLLLLSQVRCSESLRNGAPPSRINLTNDMHPLIKLHYNDQLASTCSSLRLNQYQVLTAAHCDTTSIMDGSTGGIYQLHLDACIQVKEGCIPVKKIVKHPTRDIAIMTTEQAISSHRTCFDSYITGRELKDNLRKNETSKCNFDSDYMLVSRGIKKIEDIGTLKDTTLTLGRFNGLKNNPYSLTMPGSLAMKGTLTPDGKKILAMPGDSGGPIYTCEEKSHKLKLIGLLHGGDKTTEIDLYTPITHRSVLKWARKNTAKCSVRKMKIERILLPIIQEVNED